MLPWKIVLPLSLETIDYEIGFTISEVVVIALLGPQVPVKVLHVKISEKQLRRLWNIQPVCAIYFRLSP